MGPPPALMDEEETDDLGYTEKDLFDDRDMDPLEEYISMEEATGSNESKMLYTKNETFQAELEEEDTGEHRMDLTSIAFGLKATDIKEAKNLNPTKEGIDYTKIFAPVVPIQSIRGVLAVAAVQNWEVDLIDIKQAYLNSSLQHNVYLRPLVGAEVPQGKVLKLIKGLYGLKQSGREWNAELDSHLWKISFHCMPSTPCLYTRGMGEEITVITAYVDDMLITSLSQKEVIRTKAEIMDKWGTEDNGPIWEFLGIKITRDQELKRISLDLTAYIWAMVSKWLERSNQKSWIPMLSITTIAKSSKCAPTQIKEYQELVGQLLWVSNMYLNQTNQYQLHLGGNMITDASQPVVMYTDENWASDPTNRCRSTSGTVMYVYGCPSRMYPGIMYRMGMLQ
ncbi:hypothetical protein NDA17_005304 [Ustilago hordei]|nr:hypothetical protein NDA17_005304 [Ustilago hordei]